MSATHKSDCKVSVVIPTLGGSTLANTIEILNQSSVIPSEILVCIPKKYANRVDHLPESNLRVIATDIRGQVAQRAIGFQHAQHDYVMQIDDDIDVDSRCIEYLAGTISGQDSRVAVAPAFIDVETGRSVYVKPVRNSFLDRIYYWLANGKTGYKPGEIDSSSTPVGIDPEMASQIIVPVGWLAGGCIMHRRDNLVTENFYPFEGKAFCEDIIHSQLLIDRGVKLLINADAKCHLSIFHSRHFETADFIRTIAADYRARKYFATISGRSVLRMHIFYIAWILSYMSNTMKRIIGLSPGRPYESAP